MSEPPNLDLGKLLRLDEMVTQAIQAEAVRDSAAALVHAYMQLREEMLSVLEDDATGELWEEFDRLFYPLDQPEPFHHLHAVDDQVRLASTAEEALMRLRLIGGWIKGLIRELTLGEQMRLDAEARAKQASKPPTGFSAE